MLPNRLLRKQRGGPNTGYNNRFGTLAIPGKVSFALVGRLKALT